MTDSRSPERRQALLTVQEVAETCRLSTKAVRGAIRRRELNATKPCGRWRVAPGDMWAWLAATAVDPVPAPMPAMPAPNPSASTHGSLGRLDAIEREAIR